MAEFNIDKMAKECAEKAMEELRDNGVFVSRWIPVSEGLPEDGERVLVTYDKIVIRATWDLMRYSFYDTHAVSLDKDFVYAWMPLPEPYREGGANENTP